MMGVLSNVYCLLSIILLSVICQKRQIYFLYGFAVFAFANAVHGNAAAAAKEEIALVLLNKSDEHARVEVSSVEIPRNPRVKAARLLLCLPDELQRSLLGRARNRTGGQQLK